MWDEMACRLDAQWRSVVESDEVRLRKTAYTHTHWPSDEVEWQNASRLIINGCASLGDADMRDRSIEECIADVEETCARALCVQIDTSLVKQLLSPIVINIVHGSTLLVKPICRSDITHELVGESLSMRLRAYLHRTDFQLDDYSIADDSQSVTDVLLQELVHTRQRLTLVKDVGRTGRVEDVPMICGKSVFMPAPKFKDNVLEGLGIRSLKNFSLAKASAQFFIHNKFAIIHAPTTIAEAEQLLCIARGREQTRISDSLGMLYSSSAMRYHLGWLERALDLHMKERIDQARWRTD